MIGDILQPTHLLFVLVVALLVLGPKRLPEAGRALGKGLRDFRSAISGEEDHHDGIPPEATTPMPPHAAAVPPVAHDAAVPPVATAPPAQAPQATADAVAEPAEQPTETAHPVG